MTYTIDNNYNDSFFFVAYITNNYIENKNNSFYAKVLQATSMAALLTEVNLPEHFNIDTKYIKQIKIVQAFGQLQYNEALNSRYQKDIFKVTESNYTVQPAVDFKPVIITQGIAFDRFFTDAFYVSTFNEANDKVKDWCKTAIILNQIPTKIIKNIYK